MNAFYPINLNLNEKKIVVIGGGKVAERKVLGLMGTGARVTVVSPALTGLLAKLAEDHTIFWSNKQFSAEDLDGAFLIIAAANDKNVSCEVKKAAKEHQLINFADNPEQSDFHLPSVLKRGKLQIAVSTSGASPILARQIKADIGQIYDERFVEYVDFLYDCRKKILALTDDPVKKKTLLSEVATADFLHCNRREEEFQRLCNRILKP